MMKYREKYHWIVLNPLYHPETATDHGVKIHSMKAHSFARVTAMLVALVALGCLTACKAPERAAPSKTDAVGRLFYTGFDSVFYVLRTTNNITRLADRKSEFPASDRSARRMWAVFTDQRRVGSFVRHETRIRFEMAGRVFFADRFGGAAEGDKQYRIDPHKVEALARKLSDKYSQDPDTDKEMDKEAERIRRELKKQKQKQAPISKPATNGTPQNAQ